MILFLPKYSKRVGSSRLRMYVYGENLGPYLLKGKFQFRHLFKSIFQAFKRVVILLSNRSSMIVLEKEIFPWVPFWFERILLKNSYILDYDDGIFVKYNDTILSDKIPKLARNAKMVICGSHKLQSYFDHHGANTVLIPTPILDHKIRKRHTKLSNNIVWIGQPGSVYNLNEHIENIIKFCEDSGVILNLIGVNRSDLSIASKFVVFHEWSEENEYELLVECDFGLMPVLDGEFEQFKCSYKLLQYLSVGLYPLFDGFGENALIAEELGLIPRRELSWYDYLLYAYGERLYKTQVKLPERYWLSSTSKRRNQILYSKV